RIAVAAEALAIATTRRARISAKHAAAHAPRVAAPTSGPAPPKTSSIGISRRHPAAAPARSAPYTRLISRCKRVTTSARQAPAAKNGAAASAYTLASTARLRDVRADPRCVRRKRTATIVVESAKARL